MVGVGFRPGMYRGGLPGKKGLIFLAVVLVAILVVALVF